VADNTVIHAAGDMIVRAELIQLKPGKSDFYNSRNYVYSKPIWFGKYRGDTWSADDPSPFKKLGNRMVNIVSAPEPMYGDDQSYRRRNMRVRSWKESFEGWNFSRRAGDWYEWKTFVPELPPDFLTWNKQANGGVLNDGKPTAWDDKAVWTPPIGIDMNKYDKDEFTVTPDSDGRIHPALSPFIYAAGSVAATTFGQYAYTGTNAQYVQRELGIDDYGKAVYAWNANYTPWLYGRLSLQRPMVPVIPNGDGTMKPNPTPLYGLYALRGWDFGSTGRTNVTYDADNTLKRFLMVQQGLRLPYSLKNWTRDHDRTIQLEFWTSCKTSNAKLNDMWIGEGFAPWEVKEILGLDPERTWTNADIVNLYDTGDGSYDWDTMNALRGR
jgi:hypothetical protein